MSNPAGPECEGPSSATDVPAVVPTTAGAAEVRGPGPASILVDYYRDVAAIYEKRGAPNYAAACRTRADYWQARKDAAVEEAAHVGTL